MMMQETIREIAARIREMRDLRNLTGDEMASCLGIAPGQYARYENGEDDIPASVLYGIAQRLEMDMSTLLTGENPRMNVFTVTRRDQGVRVERRKEYGYQNIAVNFMHKKGEIFVVTVEPKTGFEPHMNAHPGQECDFVLEGRMKVYIHQNEVILESGDSIYFDSSHPHAMEALDGRPARFLAIVL